MKKRTQNDDDTIGIFKGNTISIEEIKKLLHQFKKEELPNAEEPYHYEEETWQGMKHFIEWLERKESINKK
jgi:hypothetical protein